MIRQAFRPIKAFWQRGRRGWADEDTWSFDHYLARVVAGGLRYLAANAHGCPADMVAGWPDRTEHTHEELETASAKWVAWLRRQADWFEWYDKDEDGIAGDTNWIDPELSDDEKKRRIEVHEKKLEFFYTTILGEFARHFGSLWD